MAGFGEGSRFTAHMFDDGNRIRFPRPVDEAARQWWIDKFYQPFDLTPEGMADSLTKSAQEPKLARYEFIDAATESFSLRVDGELPDQQFWYVHRSLDLRGSAFSADGMFVSEDVQKRGLGTALMGDLVDTCLTIKAEKITLHAERTGRYAWAMFGFVPDAGSWAQMKRDALVFLLSHELVLGPERTNNFVRRINQGGPEAIRIIAAIDDLVPSRQLPQRFEPRLVPFARAFFLEHTANWYGSLNLRDKVTMNMVASYREAKKGSGR
jgi:GNAT superfamily N-acetyltransferase